MKPIQNYGIVKIPNLTEEERREIEENLKKRDLYVKYSISELQNWLTVDLFQAMDLDGYWGKEIPPNILKKHYRSKQAKYHPVNNDGRNEAFICISRAYEILKDRKLKKIYESHFLDESIPEDRKYSYQEFIDVFAPVFNRNAIFSENLPVPFLTDDVVSFYNFWFNFKSNRIYDDAEEVFSNSKMSTRNYGNEQNELIANKKIADRHRIKQLVELAYKRDPRIISRQSVNEVNWTEPEEVLLSKYYAIFKKSKNKYSDIANALNKRFKTRKTAKDVELKLNK